MKPINVVPNIQAQTSIPPPPKMGVEKFLNGISDRAVKGFENGGQVGGAEPELVTGKFDANSPYEPGNKLTTSFEASSTTSLPKATGSTTMPNATVTPKTSFKPLGYAEGGEVKALHKAPRKVKGIFGFSNGGDVSAAGEHPIGPTDTVPAMLTPGEFVLDKQAVDKVKQTKGIAALKRLNQGDVYGFSNGGGVPDDTLKTTSKAYNHRTPTLGDNPSLQTLSQKLRYPEAFKPGVENVTHGFDKDPSSSRTSPEPPARQAPKLDLKNPGISLKDAINVNTGVSRDVSYRSNVSDVSKDPLTQVEKRGFEPRSTTQNTINANTGVSKKGINSIPVSAAEAAKQGGVTKQSEIARENFLKRFSKPVNTSSSPYEFASATPTAGSATPTAGSATFNVEGRHVSTNIPGDAFVGPRAPKAVAPKPGIFERAGNVAKGVGGALGTVGKFAMKAATPVAIAADALKTRDTINDLDTTEDKAQAKAEMAARWGSTATGAAVGSLFGPIGSAVGGGVAYFAPEAVTHWTGGKTAEDKAEENIARKASEHQNFIDAETKAASGEAVAAENKAMLDKQREYGAQPGMITPKEFNEKTSGGTSSSQPLDANAKEWNAANERKNGPSRNSFADTPEGQAAFDRRAAEWAEGKQQEIADQRQREFGRTPEGKAEAAKEEVRRGIFAAAKQAEKVLSAPYQFADSTVAAATKAQEMAQKLIENENQTANTARNQQIADENHRMSVEQHDSQMKHYNELNSSPEKQYENQVNTLKLLAINGDENAKKTLASLPSSKPTGGGKFGIDKAQKLGLQNVAEIANVADLSNDDVNSILQEAKKIRPDHKDADTKKFLSAASTRYTLEPSTISAIIYGKPDELGNLTQHGAE
jgi:hypothetical protein